MAIIQISLLITFMLFYFLTREAWVIIKKQEKTEFEIHLPILAICIKSKKDGRDKKSERKTKLSALAYFRIISAGIKKNKKIKIDVERIIIPIDEQKLADGNFVKPLSQQYFFFSLIAYFEAKTKNISIKDNAFILSTDVTKTQFHLTIKSHIYNLIHLIVTYVLYSHKEKKKARMEKYVGE